MTDTSRYRGARRFRVMTETLMRYGFERLDYRSATVMTLKANPVTNGLFRKLGFVVYHEQPEPAWRAENAVGCSARVTREQWYKVMNEDMA